MRVLILGEGPTDLGRVEPDGILQLEGTLPILVRKLIGEVAPKSPVELHAKEISKIRRSPEGIRRIGRSQYGFANKLVAVLGLRDGRSADAIVVVVDRDGRGNKDRIAELNKGREELRQANKACAAGVAVEMIEAWLLADELALRKALGNDYIPRQPDPESLSSRDEGSENHPKGRLQRLMQESVGHEVPRSDFPIHYAAIAKAADLKILETRCPEGFGPFALQVRELPNS